MAGESLTRAVPEAGGWSPTNLPAPLTSFIGREAAIDEIRALVRRHRLVTLTGAGGSGKTRLALEVAAAVAGDHPDGVRWIDLASLSDPALVPASVATALGMQEPPEPVTDAVVRRLADRRELVLIDNCEHLIDTCADLVTNIVRRCPSVTVLATTRELLGVDGEVRYPVPPLTLPEAGAEADSESVGLFVERAAAARPGFTLTADTAPVVADICRRLDGIPLAIELAAARTRVLGVTQIADGLADRFRLLVGSTRGALPRQRTLEGSVDWSHDLLGDRERAALRRLSVFSGSFSLDAATVVAAGNDIAAEDVLELCSSLVDRSLVQVSADAATAVRYRMLETIRDYARRKLTDSGEAASARDRHLASCVSFSERAGEGLASRDAGLWLALVDEELPNLRAALDWSLESTDADAGTRIVANLMFYWYGKSEVAIGRDRLAATVDRGCGGVHRAGALTVLSHVAYRIGDMQAAARLGDDAVSIARALGDPRTLGRALQFRAWTYFWGEGDRGRAWDAFEEAEGLLRSAGDRVMLGASLLAHGWSYIDTTQAPRSRAMLEEGLELTEGTGAYLAGLFALGWLENMEGTHDSAEARFRECIRLAEDLGETYIEVFARSLLAARALDRGAIDEAQEQCALGLARAREHRQPATEAAVRWTLAAIRALEGDLEAAAVEAEEARRLTPMPWFAAIVDGFLASLALARSDRDEARRRADAALVLGRQHDSVSAMSGALTTLAALAVSDGDLQRAEDLLHDALDLVHGAGFVPSARAVLDTLSRVVAGQGRTDEAVRLHAAARSGRSSSMVNLFIRAAAEDPILGDPDATAADGEAMSLDDAIEYARRGRGARRRPSAGWKSLTPTERKVVDLVTRGLTNPQVGEQLFISRRTVQTHLAHVFAKLNVSTRAELAALATEHALGRRSTE